MMLLRIPGLLETFAPWWQWLLLGILLLLTVILMVLQPPHDWPGTGGNI